MRRPQRRLIDRSIVKMSKQVSEDQTEAPPAQWFSVTGEINRRRSHTEEPLEMIVSAESKYFIVSSGINSVVQYVFLRLSLNKVCFFPSLSDIKDHSASTLFIK